MAGCDSGIYPRDTLMAGGFLEQKFESVQSLRGIAALFVVMQHICFLERGSFGVELFFLISGFLMMYTTQKGKEHFFAKRLLRILPLYYAMTLFSYLLLLCVPSLFEQTTASPVYLIKSLLFISFSLNGTVQPLLRVGWTLNYEILFYLLFFLAMKFSFRYRALICTGFLLFLTMIGMLFPGMGQPFLFWTDSIILEFAVGMGGFYLFQWMFEKCGSEARNRKDGQNGGYAQFAALGALVLSGGLFLLEWLSYESPMLGTLPRLIRWGIPSTLILISFFYAGCVLRMPKWLVKLGDMSFSLYLIHYYPMRMVNRLLDNTKHPAAGQILLTAAAALMILAVSYICYRLVELKLGGWLKRKFSI